MAGVAVQWNHGSCVLGAAVYVCCPCFACRVAQQDERLYIRFINMMINDSQHLLQEALDTLPQVHECWERGGMCA
jgi:hypothetical protein